jgi:hypothetical protein
MRITSSFEYPAAPEQVFPMMTDPRFQAEKVEATHPLSHKESVTPRGDTTEVVTSRLMPTDGFPEFARSMIGPKIRVTETIVWGQAAADGSRSGSLSIGIGDAPVSLTGTMRLTPSALGTRVDIDGELKARVPLLGGRIEKAAEVPVRAAIDREHEVGVKWLTR